MRRRRLDYGTTDYRTTKKQASLHGIVKTHRLLSSRVALLRRIAPEDKPSKIRFDWVARAKEIEDWEAGSISQFEKIFIASLHAKLKSISTRSGNAQNCLWIQCALQVLNY